MAWAGDGRGVTCPHEAVIVKARVCVTQRPCHCMGNVAAVGVAEVHVGDGPSDQVIIFLGHGVVSLAVKGGA